MGQDFRRLLITELEKRQREIDSILFLLKRLRGGPNAPITMAAPASQSPAQAGPALSRTPRRRDSSIYDEILELRQQGLSLRAIALRVQLSPAGVWKVLHRSDAGVTPEETPKNEPQEAPGIGEKLLD